VPYQDTKAQPELFILGLNNNNKIFLKSEHRIFLLFTVLGVRFFSIFLGWTHFWTRNFGSWMRILHFFKYILNIFGNIKKIEKKNSRAHRHILHALMPASAGDHDGCIIA
jgi:hypothetical protein